MSPFLGDPGQRISLWDRLQAGRTAEVGMMLVLMTSVLFGIITEIGGAFSRAVAFAVYGLAGAFLFLLGAVLHLRIRTR